QHPPSLRANGSGLLAGPMTGSAKQSRRYTDTEATQRAAECAAVTLASVGPGAAPAERKIVGVGQAAALRRLSLLHLIGDAVTLGVGDGFVLGRKLQAKLALHVA